MSSRCARGESGAVAPLVAVMLLGLLAVAALVVDGGVLFAARRDLQGLADGAARAGAMAVDIETLRETEKVRLAPVEAEVAAHEYLRAVRYSGISSVSADILSVTVHLSDTRSTLMMGLLGVDSVEVEARSVARPRTGIESPEG
jgi:Putative Flp pilus-assembly TadE/G-like